MGPPPPLVSELNADEDAEQPELQVDSGEPEEVTTPGNLDDNEPEAATLSPVTPPNCDLDKDEPEATLSPTITECDDQDEFDKPKPSTTMSLNNGWPTGLIGDCANLKKDVIVCWVEPLTPEVYEKMKPGDMPHEAYAEVTGRIKQTASNHGQALTNDGLLWTQISTEKGAARFA